MGLAILVLFLLAWAVVLGGPVLARYLRSREGGGDDPVRDPFAALGRSVERSVPRVDVPLEPRVVPLGGTGTPVPAEVRRRRAVLVLVGAAAVLLLLAIATGSAVLWVLQLLVDVLFVAYTVALVRHAHPSGATLDGTSGSESVRELLLRSRRFVVPAVAVVAVGAVVFGGVVMAGSGGDHSDGRAAAVEGATGAHTAASGTVRTPRTTTGVTLPEAPPPPPPGTAPAPPPATQPPNRFCVLLHAFC